MKIRTKFSIIFVTMCLTFASLVVFFVYHIFEISKPIQNDIPKSINNVSKKLELDRLTQLTKYYNETTIQSVRNYAFTGKKHWLQRYYTDEFEFNQTITNGIEASEGEEYNFFEQFEQKDHETDCLERIAIDYVNNNQKSKAIEILESEEYWKTQRFIDSSISEYFSQRGIHFNNTFESSIDTIRLVTQQISTTIHNAFRIAFIFIIFMSIMLIASGIYFSKYIVTPIRMLTNHFRKISDGNLALRIIVSSKDEIGELADSWNNMSIKLMQTQGDLEKRAFELGSVNNEMKHEIEIRKQAELNLKNTHAQLVHSEKLAGIGQLAAGVAHEINNPIGFVLGNSEILIEYFDAIKKLITFYEERISNKEKCDKREELDINYIMNDIDSLLNDNLNGLKRVISIVTNLKNFARADQQDEFVESNLEENLNTTLSVAKNEIKYYADVITNYNQISPVFCNIGEVNQVFLNIIVNASQAIREYHIAQNGLITISTREDSDSVYCSIADNGPGIPDTIKQRIFEPFFTTKPAGKGTGLGLSIAWDIIVNRHRGEITITSEVNKGTCFIIKLPKVRRNKTV
jgi:signal transduction histidine kinase